MMDDREDQCKIYLDRRLVFFSTTFVFGLLCLVNVFGAVLLVDIFPPRSRAWITGLPLLGSMMLTANSLVELIQRKKDYQDFGFQVGMNISMFCALTFIFSGLSLAFSIGAESDLLELNSFRELQVEKSGFASYNFGLFHFCCLAGAGLYDTCDSPFRREINVDKNLLAEYCVKTPELFELARTDGGCPIIDEARICDDTISLREFNNKIYLYTDEVFGPVSKLLIFTGFLLVMSTLYMFCSGGNHTFVEIAVTNDCLKQPLTWRSNLNTTTLSNDNRGTRDEQDDDDDDTNYENELRSNNNRV